MNLRCPRPECISRSESSENPVLSGRGSGSFVRFGSFFRRSDSRQIERFRCRGCRRTFSRATTHPYFGQKKRRVNTPLNLLLCSGVSQRRAAKILRVNPKTVARKLPILAAQARREHEKFLRRLLEQRLSEIQFDDLETSEHSKCKPLSVALAVEPKTRTLLTFQVSQMPPKGLLAAPARRKYGPRRDRRARGWNRLMRDLKPYVRDDAVWLSDQNPHYGAILRRHYPEATHKTAKGRRGCVAGQGELKKIGFDPLFSLNHTCAMLRANLNRLFRRTWCTTKKRERLRDHLDLYVSFHNRVLIGKLPLPSTA